MVAHAQTSSFQGGLGASSSASKRTPTGAKTKAASGYARRRGAAGVTAATPEANVASSSSSFASEREASIARDVVDTWMQVSNVQPYLDPLEEVAETLEVDNPSGSTWVEGNWRSTPTDLEPHAAATAIQPAIVVTPPKTTHPAVVALGVAGAGALLAAAVPFGRKWIADKKAEAESLKLLNQQTSAEAALAREQAERLSSQLKLAQNRLHDQGMIMERMTREARSDGLTIRQLGVYQRRCRKLFNELMQLKDTTTAVERESRAELVGSRRRVRELEELVLQLKVDIDVANREKGSAEERTEEWRDLARRLREDLNALVQELDQFNGWLEEKEQTFDVLESARETLDYQMMDKDDVTSSEDLESRVLELQGELRAAGDGLDYLIASALKLEEMKQSDVSKLRDQYGRILGEVRILEDNLKEKEGALRSMKIPKGAVVSAAVERAYTQLKSDWNELLEERNSLAGQVNDLSGELSDAKERVDSVQTALAKSEESSTEQAAKLLSELEAARGALAEHQMTAAAIRRENDARIASMKQEILQYKNAHAEHESNIRNVAREMNTLRAQLAEKTQAFDTTADSLADARRRLAELSSSTQEERASFKKQSESWASTEAVMNERIETLRRRAEVLEQDLERTQSLATQYEQQYVDLAQTGTEDRTAIVDELRRSEELLLERLNAIQMEYNQKCRVAEFLKMELNKAKFQSERSAKIKEVADSLNARVADLEQQRAEVEETKLAQQREIDMLREEIEMSRRLLEDSMEDIETSQQRMADLSALADSAKSELATAKQELEEMVQKRREAEEDMEARSAMTQKEKDEAVAALQSRVDELVAEHDTMTKEAATLKGDLAVKGAQLSVMQREKRSALEDFHRVSQEKREEMEKMRGEMESQLKYRQEAMSKEKQRAEDLMAEVASLRMQLARSESDREVEGANALADQARAYSAAFEEQNERLRGALSQNSALESKIFRLSMMLQERSSLARQRGGMAGAWRGDGSGFIDVAFRIDYRTEMGEEMCVCGGGDHMGNWDVAKAIPMRCIDGGHVWRAEVEMPAGSIREYKYVIRRCDEKWNAVRWQVGNNRVLALRTMSRYPEGAKVFCSDNWAGEPTASYIAEHEGGVTMSYVEEHLELMDNHELFDSGKYLVEALEPGESDDEEELEGDELMTDIAAKNNAQTRVVSGVSQFQEVASSMSRRISSAFDKEHEECDLQRGECDEEENMRRKRLGEMNSQDADVI
ncbi:carbohydrate-binding-like protein [Pycnococcus provasolii]